MSRGKLALHEASPRAALSRTSLKCLLRILWTITAQLPPRGLCHPQLARCRPRRTKADLLWLYNFHRLFIVEPMQTARQKLRSVYFQELHRASFFPVWQGHVGNRMIGVRCCSVQRNKRASKAL
ncbi:hypothetical protein K437DRAFT_77074 [Tilletiaria anomala UBC 951]|uniref:Uncharacterized protein n=1 Tax=Tilletiaria anomala (strain ATCC 24038 / CBS 436.72 / UBC 951) TaxID=1037660 RepID=A0A066WES7_TILAU|nr:uncharacterized protein K437DRAFT_77074 [Tilletiaria anomala UBC 951]KDN49594.1 hypothetical protein K437DRAFT_77074 [Tilletiaria anomala UBC 951]